MRRLPLLDAVLIAVLVPGWILALGLHLWQRHQGYLVHFGIYVAAPATADGHPTVSGFWPGHDAAGFALGDRLHAVGATDLRGAGPYRFFALAHEEMARSTPAVAPIMRVERGGRLREAPLPLVAPHAPWRILPLTIGFAATGTLVLLNRPGIPVARAFFLAAMAFGIHWTFFFGGPRLITYVWYAVYLVVSTLMFPLVLLTASMFPEGSPRRRWVWGFVVSGPIVLTASVGAPLPPAYGLPAMYVLNVALALALIGIVARNYARATPVGRRQLRWGLLGICAGTIPAIAVNLLILAMPDLWWLHELSGVLVILIPVSIFVALSRFNLYEIDRLLTSTLLYSLVLALLLWGTLVAVPLAARALAAASGIDPTLGLVGLAAVVALVLVTLAQSFNPALERLLFKERYALQDGVKRLLADVRGISDQRTLLGLVGHRLSDLFRAVSCAVYEPADGRWVALVSVGSFRGRETAPDLGGQGVLGPDIAGADAPIDMEAWRAAHPVTTLPIDDRLVLEHLAPAVVLPVRAGSGLLAAITLGSKHSGETYSSGDLALLSAVAETLANELTRIERTRRTATAPVLVPSRYTVLGEIGRGGMGIVYLVRHVALETNFALKILRQDLAVHDDLVQRFLREARIMSQLRHPNIVRVFDVDAEADMFSFVMEHVKGRPLSEILAAGGPMPPWRVAALAAQIGEALTHAHTRQPAVIHRDVKPANILVEDDTGRAVVTDFGIAKVVGAEESFATQTGSRLGTLQYCSPEQLRGERDLDPRCDVYAFGMVLYEMLTGRPLLRDLSSEEICHRVLWEPAEHRIDLDEQLPRALATVIATAVRKDRERRYPSIAAILADFAAVVPVRPQAQARATTDVLPTIGSAPDRSGGAAPRDGDGGTDEGCTRHTRPGRTHAG